MSKLPTTSKVTSKRYRCVHCGAESQIATNHWGEVYSRCNACAWKRPGMTNKHECLDPMPGTHARPEPWAEVKLGDVVSVEAYGVAMARKAFIRKIPDALERMEFENQVLSIDSEYLPEIAVAVRDHGAEPTAEYWRFLASQVRS